nr:hypothetical protein [Candidatus Sigynarchaeota archaeon]
MNASISKPSRNQEPEQGLIIDPEFSSLIPPPGDDEIAGLERSLLEHGFDPALGAIITWKKTIVDGHNRYRLCEKHGIPFHVEERPFKNRDDAARWIVSNQLDRRNITPEQRAYLVGKRYMAEKKPGIILIPGRARARIAAETGSSEATVSRDEKFALAIDAMAKNADMPANELLSRKLRMTQKDAIDIAALPAEHQKRVVRELKAGKRSVDAIREVKKKERETRVVSEPALPGEYNIILVEPHSRGVAVENSYPSVDLDEIKLMVLPAAKDSVIFLSTNGRGIASALDVLKAWNFAYHSCLPWIRGRSFKLYLIATRGNPVLREIDPVADARGKDIHQIIEAAYPGRMYLDVLGKNADGSWETLIDKINLRRYKKNKIY